MARDRMRAILLATLLTPAVALEANAAAPEPAPARPLVFFRAGFDGDLHAKAAGKDVSPATSPAVEYVAGDHSQAVVIRKGAGLRYGLPEGFPCDAGSLELVFRPDFPQVAEEPQRTVLALRGKDGSELTLSFQPVGYRWEFVLKSPGQSRVVGQLWYGKAEQGRWQHFLLAWDRTAELRPVVNFFHNGKAAGALTYVPPRSLLTVLEVGGADKSEVSVDEVAIYTRALTESQAAFLASSAGQKGDRLAALADRIAADDRDAAQRRAARRALVAQLQGKVGRLIHLRGEKPQDFSFPEKITATGIRPEDVGVIDLRRFRVIYFPEGGMYQLSPEQEKRIVEYVRSGGGYVGSCLGAFAAHRLKILDFVKYPFLEQGLISINLAPHVVTEGYGQTVVMHHGNGPIMVPGSGCRAIGTYAMGNPNETAGAILVGMCAQGRVVLFGPHPLGGGLMQTGKSASFTAADLGTDRMIVNALLYAARIIGDDEPVAAEHVPRAPRPRRITASKGDGP